MTKWPQNFVMMQKKDIKFNNVLCPKTQYFRGKFFVWGHNGPGEDFFLGGGGSPLCNILKYPFLVTDPKNFLKVPWAPIYTIFEGGAQAKKKRDFSVNIFKKCLKRFFGLFFQNLPAAQKVWSK